MEFRCKVCRQTFLSLKDLYTHKKSIHGIKRQNGIKFCEYCKQYYSELYKVHEKNCPALPHGTDRKQTPESRKRISEARKKWLKEHPDQYPWRRKDKFKSVPCEHLKEILREDNYKFIEEYTDNRWEHYYSLDIAFLDKKLAVEVNGTQHYNKDGTLAPYYQKRHDYLESQGWTILEIFYTKCFKEEEITKIKNAIDTCQSLSDDDTKLLIQNMRKSKEEREKEKLEKQELRKKLKQERQLKKKKLKEAQKAKPKRQPKIKLPPRIRGSWSKLPEEKWMERKEKILNSGIDLTKYGWWNKLVIKTGLTKRQIEHTFKHFKEDFKNCKFTSRRIL